MAQWGLEKIRNTLPGYTHNLGATMAASDEEYKQKHLRTIEER
jgi:hypothetical protein